jgi:putative endonuclease
MCNKDAGMIPISDAAAGCWRVYLLECADGTLYCGVTTDLTKRLAEHNGELPGGARYTAARRPVRLVASRVCKDRREACQLEWRIKRLRKGEKLSFFESLGGEENES